MERFNTYDSGPLKALACGLAKCGLPVGMILFSPVTSKIVDSFEWQGIPIMYAIMFGFLGIISGIIPPLPSKAKDDYQFIGSNKDDGKQQKIWEKYLGTSLFTNPIFPLLIISRLFGYLSLDAFEIFYPQYLTKEKGFSSLQASGALSTLGLFSALGQIGSGLASDKWRISPTLLVGFFTAVAGRYLLLRALYLLRFLHLKQN